MGTDSQMRHGWDQKRKSHFIRERLAWEVLDQRQRSLSRRRKVVQVHRWSAKGLETMVDLHLQLANGTTRNWQHMLRAIFYGEMHGQTLERPVQRRPPRLSQGRKHSWKLRHQLGTVGYVSALVYHCERRSAVSAAPEEFWHLVLHRSITLDWDICSYEVLPILPKKWDKHFLGVCLQGPRQSGTCRQVRQKSKRILRPWEWWSLLHWPVHFVAAF